MAIFLPLRKFLLFFHPQAMNVYSLTEIFLERQPLFFFSEILWKATKSEFSVFFSNYFLGKKKHRNKPKITLINTMQTAHVPIQR